MKLPTAEDIVAAIAVIRFDRDEVRAIGLADREYLKTLVARIVRAERVIDLWLDQFDEEAAR